MGVIVQGGGVITSRVVIPIVRARPSAAALTPRIVTIGIVVCASTPVPVMPLVPPVPVITCIGVVTCIRIVLIVDIEVRL